jgi:hypothetical protein
MLTSEFTVPPFGSVSEIVSASKSLPEPWDLWFWLDNFLLCHWTLVELSRRNMCDLLGRLWVSISIKNCNDPKERIGCSDAGIKMAERQWHPETG